MLFVVFYTYVTPFDEILLIRQGNAAAALSLGGAVIGFSLTVASCIAHTPDYQQFLLWAAGALFAQLSAYLVTTRLFRISKDHIETGNVAFGGILGAVSIAVGAVNAACIV